MPEQVVIINKRIDQLHPSAGPILGGLLAMFNPDNGKTEKIGVEFFSNVQTSNYDWLSDTEYLENDARIHGGKWWKALQDVEANVIPGSDPAMWEEVNKGSSGGKKWVAGVYPELNVYVVNDLEGRHKNYALVNETRPFISSDFEAELLAGDWKAFFAEPVYYHEWNDGNSFSNLDINNNSFESWFGSSVDGSYSWFSTSLIDLFWEIYDEGTDSGTRLQVYWGTAGQGPEFRFDKSLKIASYSNPVKGTFHGAEYEADYSAYYTDRTLVDKGFVMSVIGGGGGGPAVAAKYADIAELFAEQADQTEDKFYLVYDASADPTVDTGWALYHKKGTTTGALTDYRKTSEQESLDILFNTIVNYAASGEITKSDGTNLVGTKVFSTSDGNLELGQDTFAGLVRTIEGKSSGATVWLVLKGKGVLGTVYLGEAGSVGTYLHEKLLIPNKSTTIPTVSGAAQLFTEGGQFKVKEGSGTEFIVGQSSGSNLDLVTVSVAAGTMTLDFANGKEKRFVDITALSANFIVAFANDTNGLIITLNIFITGSIAITMPTSVVMQTSESGRWNNTTKVLTLTGTTAQGFEMSFTKIGSVWKLKVSESFYAS